MSKHAEFFDEVRERDLALHCNLNLASRGDSHSFWQNEAKKFYVFNRSRLSAATVSSRSRG